LRSRAWRGLQNRSAHQEILVTHRSPNAEAIAALDPDVGLIVHSHLRWDFVWQRPQQLLSRIACNNPVLFVEEPLLLDDLRAPVLELSMPDDGVHRAIPKLPRRGHEEYDDAVAAIRSLVRDALRMRPLAGHFDRVIQWFYTPMPAPEMLGAFGEEGVVYDCMDELSQFRFAPTDIGRRERLLLSRADVVFTGGHRLYESKSRFHDNVHFFGCGVDASHFATARCEETIVPPDAAELPRPVLGYFGVIDERLDYGLLSALATSRPEWTLLMIGPAVKVDPRDLPRAHNIHWLGQRAYTELPHYVKAFDVCLMPFALNEATEFINPTKTLEYMAAGKPVVSTPVADVVHNFAPIVRVAGTPDTFVAAVAEAVEQPDTERLEQGMERAASASWEAIVQRMRELIADAVAMRLQESGMDDLLDAVPPTRARSERRISSAVPATVLAPDRSEDAA
jgi:glycosyltransferase involved in cell wall biosynthesis